MDISKLSGTPLRWWNSMLDVLTKVHWPRFQALLNGGVYYRLQEEDHDKIRELLSKDYLIILTRTNSHLTTLLISIASLIVSRQYPRYVHALMNVEGDIPGHIGYKLIEATAKGVHYSTFMQVFNCDSVALLAPKGISLHEWTAVLDTVKKQLGTPYDTLFDLATNERVSCVEMIYWGLKTLPNYEERFPKLLKMIREDGNLTPQMLYDSGEFDIVFEVRR